MPDATRNPDRLYIRAKKVVEKATVADIDRAQNDPKARQLVLDTHASLRRFLKLCGIDLRTYGELTPTARKADAPKDS